MLVLMDNSSKITPVLVNLVKNNVTPVTDLPPTVSIAPCTHTKEVQLQNVQSSDKESTPLKSMTSQSVPPSFSIVVVTV